MHRHLISLGWRGDTAFQLRMHGQENTAHFFDWLDTPINGLLRILESDFDVFHPEGLILRTDLKPHSVQDLPTGVLFHHQFPLFAGNMQPDFLVYYPAFINKFKYLAARFRSYLAQYPVTLVRQNINKQEALRLEEIVSQKYQNEDVRFLYLNPLGETFETPLGRSYLLKQEGSLGIPSEWIKVLQLEGLINVPYRHATAEILGAAHDDHNLSADNRFSEPQMREAIAINPEKIEFRLELSRWYALRSQWAKAEEEALIALIRAPQNKAAQFAALHAQWRCANLSAEAAAEQVLAILDSPSPPTEWLAAASSILLAAKQPQEALCQIRRALEVQPTEQHLYFRQADCLFHLRQHEFLARSIEVARRLGNVPAHYEHLLATAYEGQGKLEDALQASSRAVSSQASFNHLFTQAGLFLKLGQYDAALEACEKAKPIAGDFIQALENRITEIQSKFALKAPVYPGLRDIPNEQESKQSQLRRLPFVSVAYEADFSNLLLQARSLSLFGKDVVSQWLILVNDDEDLLQIERRLEPHISGAPFSWRILSRKEILDIDYTAMPGYKTQQILKLAISLHISEEYYILLDAKNHAIRPLVYSDFFSDGLPKIHSAGYYEGNVFYSYFKNAFELCGVSGDLETFRKYQTTTPYPMRTHIARECMRPENLIRLEPWYSFIVDGTTNEFGLYAGMSEKFEARIFPAQQNYETMFIGWPVEKKDILKCISQMAEAHIKFFAIHHGRVNRLEEDEVMAISRFWAELGLFDTAEKGVRFLKNNEI